MNKKTQSTQEMPGGQSECVEDDGVVNDSMGTVDVADSTGTGEEEKPRMPRRAARTSAKTEWGG